jgi:hypothetical protein
MTQFRRFRLLAVQSYIIPTALAAATITINDHGQAALSDAR